MRLVMLYERGGCLIDKDDLQVVLCAKGRFVCAELDLLNQDVIALTRDDRFFDRDLTAGNGDA